MRPDTIAFVSTYEHPSRDSVEAMIRRMFPEYRVENIVVKDVVKANRGWLLPNLFNTLIECGGRIARRKSSLRDSFFQSSYVFRRIHDAMPAYIDPGRHVFSFQTQSLYDTSVPGVPHFIYTDHTHLSNLETRFFDARDLRSVQWRALERTIYHNATRVFTRSHNVSADLAKHYGIDPGKVKCVYAGANVDTICEPRAAAGYAGQRILFVGGDWERKGGPELVQAFERVLRECPEAQLIIAGTKPALTLRNCTVLGNLPLQALAAQFEQASLFCLPTRLEPFGIVVLEAMSHRLPVVATNEGALPDMIKDGVTGRMVTPGDVRQLADVLIELLRDPAQCREFGETGYRLMRERYTWPAVGERMRAEILPCLATAP